MTANNGAPVAAVKDATATLDPADWDAFATLAHRMVDDMLGHLRTVRDRPAWQPMPADVRASFHEPVPWEGEGAERVYEEFVRTVLPYPNGNLHPRFWGWVHGGGTPLGMMADMLASGLNAHLAGFNQAPALVEHEVIRWLAELMGMPSDASGVLVSGATMANVLGLAVARYVKARDAGFDVREEGLQGSGQPRLMLYGSAETHAWANKAAELLGLGRASFRQIPVDDAYQIDVAALEAAVAADRAAGHLPFCVIGTAGTVNTGATDDLEWLAGYCRSQHLWFHVDGAFGALARLSPALRPIVAGIEQADSVSFDLHKWMYLPFEVACVLVRDSAAHRAAFAATASYLAVPARGVAAGGFPFAERGMDLTRNFKALKVWMSMKAHGVHAYAALIEQNVADAQYLAALAGADPDLELLAPAPLNVVCFRYAPADVVPGRLDALNTEILIRVQEEGIAVPSGTRVRGRYAIRVANVNHRSRREDFAILASAVKRIGREIVASGRPAAGVLSPETPRTEPGRA
jgi:aromatic-L-amino-acid/L-tryptophan decarboxylase